MGTPEVGAGPGIGGQIAGLEVDETGSVWSVGSVG